MEGVELLVIVVAIFVGAFMKGMTGTGLPQIAIPIMAIFLGVERAVIVMAIPGVLTNAWMVWRYRHHLRFGRDLWVLGALGMGGAVLGTFGLTTFDARALAGILAGMIIVSLVVRFAHPGFRLEPAVSRYTSPPVGAAAGLLQGATGISGPLMTVYLHSFRQRKEVFMASIVTLFLLFAIPQTTVLFATGSYTPNRIAESLLALVPIAVALPLGNRLSDRLSARAFDGCVVAVLVASAAKLLYDAFVG
ncbi:sulfite exporter TauE/SafE family protein [Spiractinospora alimapuensis]|uniref:sulfite exporter TauE/SafE family protein n=1 Tax=Spiractinospora alimapuensis TaxID=2820884 RepID=UPI001F3CA115|nr:sulfite exporter TauE/SafE family protein [Spiractinospora alimapuensis]QVQ52553.1 sulfite exporter TauE/SafE family protein [Spiractinospora alimapuensis]